MAASTPFDSWMRKTAEVAAPTAEDPWKHTHETLGFVRNAIPQDKLNNYITYEGMRRGVAKLPVWSQAAAGKLLGQAPEEPKMDEAKFQQQLVGEGGIQGYWNAFNRARGVDAMTQKYIDPKTGFDWRRFAAEGKINVDENTPEGAINARALQNPQFLGQTNQALQRAGQGAWEWAKQNPLLVGGGLGLAGVLAAGAFGGGGRSDDDDDDERPARPMNWAATRYWRRQ